MILIIAALKAELVPLIQRYNALQKERVASGTIFLSEKIHLLRTGVGMQKARDVLTAYLQKYHPYKIINVGTAGALNPNLTMGMVTEVVNIQSEYSDIVHINPLYSNKQIFERANLLTVKEAVTDKQQKRKIFTEFKADIVDMEAYTLAKIASQNDIDFHCVKIISDLADNNTVEGFKNNYTDLCNELSAKLIDYFSTYL